MCHGNRPADRIEKQESGLLEGELSVHLGAANNAKKKGEDEAVNDNNVVDLDEQINKVKTMEVDVIIFQKPNQLLEELTFMKAEIAGRLNAYCNCRGAHPQ